MVFRRACRPRPELAANGKAGDDRDISSKDTIILSLFRVCAGDPLLPDTVENAFFCARTVSEKISRIVGLAADRGSV